MSVQGSFLPARKRHSILGLVAGRGTYAVVGTGTRSTECSRNDERDEHDAKSGQACLPPVPQIRADRTASGAC